MSDEMNVIEFVFLLVIKSKIINLSLYLKIIEKYLIFKNNRKIFVINLFVYYIVCN